MPPVIEVWDALKGSRTQYTIIHYVNSSGGQTCCQFLLSYDLGMKIQTPSSEDVKKICKLNEFKAINSLQTGDCTKL